MEVDAELKTLRVIGDHWLNIFQSAEYSDVTLLVDKERYHSHRLVLATQSEVFAAMLTQTRWPESQLREVRLTESAECCSVFSAFLRFLYCGRTALTTSSVLPLLVLADKYAVNALASVCVCFMRANLTAPGWRTRVGPWWRYSLMCDHSRLTAELTDMVRANLDSLCIESHFLNVLDERMMLGLVQSSHVTVPREMSMLQLALRWLRQRSHCGTLARRILSHIRFPQLSLSQLEQVLQETEMLNTGLIPHVYRVVAFHGDGELRPAPCTAAYYPRNYTSDTWSTVLTLRALQHLPKYKSERFHFSTPQSCAICMESQTHDWVVEVFPKGVHFPPCMLISVPNNVELPGRTLDTIRLTVQHVPSPKICVVKADVEILIQHGHSCYEGSAEATLEKRKEITWRCSARRQTHTFCASSPLLVLDNLLPTVDLTHAQQLKLLVFIKPVLPLLPL